MGLHSQLPVLLVHRECVHCIAMVIAGAVVFGWCSYFPVKNALFDVLLRGKAHVLNAVQHGPGVAVGGVVLNAQFHASSGTRKSLLIRLPKSLTRSRKLVR